MIFLKAYASMIAAGLLAVALVVTGLALTKEKSAHQKTTLILSQERAGWATERATAATKLANLPTEYRATEQTLAQDAATTEARKNEQIHALTGRAADLARRLRIEASNAATARLLPGASATGSAPAPAPVCDGDRLSNRASDDLVRLAARAETVRLQLKACTTQYNAARVALGGVGR